ncbi:MAG: hypothetical protein K6F86_03865 [Lachnospiraceae bacterium]|nr:hypothetical protein [Lachnospiraceae bacterium]
MSEDGFPAEENAENEPKIDFDVSEISMNGAEISLGFDDEQFTVSMAVVVSENGPDEGYDGWINDVFENDELSVPLRSTTEFGKYTGDPELEIVVSEDHIFKKDDDGFEKFAVSQINAADSTYSLNYKDELMPESIIFESIRKNQTLFASLKEHEVKYNAFRELYEENCKVTLSANLDISSADASKDATAETEVEITLTNLDVIVSANELTLTSTKMEEGNTLSLYFKADHVDGLDGFEKWNITSQNSVCGAFGTTLNSSSTVSANVEFNTGNGKIYIKDVKPLMESGEDWCNVFRKYVTPGVTFVPEGKDRGADMTVVNEDEELTVTQAGTTVLYDDYDYWDGTPLNFKDSFTVKIGNTDVLGSFLRERLMFLYAVDDSTAWNEVFPENLHAGQKISISVNYWAKEEKLKTPKSGPITFQIAKQPVVVRLKKPEKFTPTESEKSPAKVYGSRQA